MAQSMGIGRLGDPDISFKRKFRWTLAFNTCSGFVPEHYVKVASRPSLTIEETDIHFLNAHSYIPGKGTWETTDVTYLDVSTQDVGNTVLFSWLDSVYQFLNSDASVTLKQGSRRKDYEGTGYLELFDGCGSSLEFWIMQNCFPTSIKFGELDYSSSEICEIEVTLRYTAVEYTNSCGQDPKEGCCTPCR